MSVAAAEQPSDAPRVALAANLLSFALAAGGFALVVLGQYMISRNFENDLDGIKAIGDFFKDVYRWPRSVVAGAALLFAGGVMFAAGTLGLRSGNDIMPARDAAAPRPLPRLLARLGDRAALSLRLLTLGVAAWAFVIVRLLMGEYQHALTWFFWFSLVCIGLAVVAFWWRGAKHIPLAIKWWEPVVLGAAVTFFLVVCIRDIESWRYAAIGDEYAFFTFAEKMYIGQDEHNIWSQIGVYAQRPVGTSAIQALSMEIFGADNFGWRMATVVALAAAIPAVYILGRELFDRRVAAFAALFFATSHYLIAYAHTVYDNVFALVPFAWAVALMVIGIRRASAPWMYAAGVVAGLTVYTFPTARMAPMVMIVFFATLGFRAWQPRMLVPMLGAMFFTAMPLLASDKWDAISVARDRTLFGFTDHPTETSLDRFIENLPRSFLGFNYNINNGHFVSGSLLDPIVAVLFVLGLAYAAFRIVQPAYRLPVLWWALALLFAGLLSPYDRVAYDRLHLLLPVVTLLAGVGVAAVLDMTGVALPPRVHRPGLLAGAVFVALAPMLVSINLDRFLVQSPDRVPTTDARLMLAGIMTKECTEEERTLAVMLEPEPLLRPALASYRWDRVVEWRRLEDAGGQSDYGSYGCVVVFRDLRNTAATPDIALTDRLQAEYGFALVHKVGSKILPFESWTFVRGG